MKKIIANIFERLHSVSENFIKNEEFYSINEIDRMITELEALKSKIKLEQYFEIVYLLINENRTEKLILKAENKQQAILIFNAKNTQNIQVEITSINPHIF